MKISAVSLASASLALLLAVPALAAGQQPAADQQAAAGQQAAAQSSQSSANQPAPSPALSKVRVVRLSEVKGDVRMDRGAGNGFEPAIANLPIVEKCRLQTGNGVAEVEFEDNSTLRLAPGSEVEFPTLERLASGGTRSTVRVFTGMAYVSLMKSPANEFKLLFGQQSLDLPAASHVRLQMVGSNAKLAVLGGDVRVPGPEGLMDVPHKRTITFALAGPTQPEIAKSIASNPLDEWDHNSEQYHARRATMSALNNTPYSYGLNDMMYYGDFASAGGCGMMWRPYFASAAWDPYANGAWAYYGGGMGYSWVSPYPWGWTPYHYGSWSFCPGTGWGWMPGGSWMGVNNTASFTHLQGPISRPRMPAAPPRFGQPGLLAVNQKPLVRSGVDSSNSFLFRKDSAGLGVPRNELGRLNKFSEHAISRGTATTPVYMQLPASRPGPAGSRNTFAGVPAMHRGAPPAAEPQGGGMAGPGRMGGPGGQPGGRGGPPQSGPSSSGGSMPGGWSRPSMSNGPSGGGGGGRSAPAGNAPAGGRR